MPLPEDHGQRIRQGLRRAVKSGRVLGGLRPARDQENKRMHLEALEEALDYRDVIERGREKSLSALSRDLFAAGCVTSKGKPLTPGMVRRLRARLEEALLAIDSGDLEDNSSDWNARLLDGINEAVQQRNRVSLVWHLRMIRKEQGETVAYRVVRSLMGSEHAAWVRDVLKQG
ncbi:MAG: hypothetical protein QUV07_11900 [Cyanobium sp. CZS 25K]|nr:hypothetical protein [Cyanobium sp. CZS25K]